MYNRIPNARLKNIVYASIWNRTELIAEYSLPGNMHSMVQKLVEEGVKPNTRASFNYENNYHIHCYNLDLKTYIVIVEAGYSKKLSFELIEEMKEIRYPSNKDLEEKVQKFNKNQDEDKITRINNQVTEINNIVMGNIQKVLKNTTKLEVIAKKTEEMESRALLFKKTGEELSYLARCQNIKWTIICSCCGVVLVVALGVAFYYAVN